MLNGHFDFGNGYHGRVYLNPHQLFRYPSTIWRFAQDLLDVLPASIVDATEVVAGPVTGGALLAHTIAGLLDSRREHHPAADAVRAVHARRRLRAHAQRASTASRSRASRCCSWTTCATPGRRWRAAPTLVREAGGTVIATAEIYDRMEAMVDAGVPNVALAEYKAPDNYPANACPLCKAGTPVTTF